MNFYDHAGKLSIGSRIRHLGELFETDAQKIYALYGNQLKPKWFSSFYFLSKQKQSSAAEVAEVIGHSHVSAGRILNEMHKAGLITMHPDHKDGRRTHVALSKLGQKLAQRIELQYTDVQTTISEMEKKSTHDLWAALREWENLMNQIPFFERVKNTKAQREIEIIEYSSKYKSAFRDLNIQWITEHFRLEPQDLQLLNNPKKYILDPGGAILVALHHGKSVGVCAIQPQDKDCFELIKMAVAPAARGNKIGRRLGEAAIIKAQSLGASKIYLESNTSLTAAIHLYSKLGFKKVTYSASPYERCNIQMVKDLKK